MNVVGKVGSLISQGVHSVTAPFLPFGGAVDIIVVQQLDGTFRSTPWHVRFGKSQGALKEEDKIVRVTVNGVEAEFFMYLDNSGAAYFVREVGSGEGSDGDMVLKHPDNVVGTQEQSSINDTNNVIMEQYGGNGNDVYNVMIQLQDEGSELAVDQIERMESDSEMKFYEFQDVQSSFESSAELSEYGSNWYYSDIDRVKHQKKSWDLNPEVVLMSVGGCILTAPISSSKEKITDVQSCTPQSHFELDLGTKYFEANADFRTGEEAALTDYSRDLPTSSPKFRSENSCSISNIDSAFRQQLKVFEAEGDHLYEVEENENVANQGGDHCADRNLEATWTDIREEDVFKSCLDLAALVTLNEDSSREVLDSPLEPHKVIGDSREKSPSNLQSANETGVRDFGESKKITSSNPSPHGDVMCPSRGVKPIECTNNSPGKVVFLDSESCLQNQSIEPTSTSSSVSGSPHKQLIRTNVPTTEQVVSLGLKEGQNMLTFSFSTGGLGLQQLDACIYLWKWNARIVISDVDGTITKSDVLGQFMPLVGREWTQSGVARLYSAIKENGYELLFLSARAIVQAYLTRSFLLNLKQDGKALPNGPVVISPDGLFPALYREVIRRTPHEFKIACLKDIKALFPSDYNPFYAGFGNRDSDELSYRKIGIPEGKIFIINPKGEVAINHCLDVKSYASIHKLVDDMFPPTSMFEQEDFNSWNYWKMPLPDVDC